MYAAFLATLVVMLRSETLVDSVWLLVVLFILFNAFSSLTSIHAIATRISMSSTFACATTGNGTTPLCPRQLIDRILQSPDVDSEQKAQLKKMVATEGELSFYDVFTLTRAGAAQ